MNCAAAAPLLAAHGDSALGPVDRAAVKAHLSGCATCRANSDAVADRVGRLEAVLAGYRVRLGAVDPHVEAARAAMSGRRAGGSDLAVVWVLLVIFVPALIDIVVVVAAALLQWALWWRADGIGFVPSIWWLVATGVPGMAGALLIVAWRRLRAESEGETPESLLLALAAAVSALLAWWPLVGVVAQAARPPAAWAVSVGSQQPLTMAHLVLGLVALLVATLVAGPMMHRPARGAARQHDPAAPGRDAVRSRLEDAMRLAALGCFERSGDLMESVRIAEEALPDLAHRLGAANAPGVTLRSWTSLIATEAAPEGEGAPERSTAWLSKVVERRELESTLFDLPPDARAVAYLRLVQQVPLTRAQALLGCDPAGAARGLATALEALERFGRSPSSDVSQSGTQ